MVTSPPLVGCVSRRSAGVGVSDVACQLPSLCCTTTTFLLNLFIPPPFFVVILLSFVVPSSPAWCIFSHCLLHLCSDNLEQAGSVKESELLEDFADQCKALAKKLR